jgi:Ser/Thr protein kinase RdoA (MazF antagonist)
MDKISTVLAGMNIKFDSFSRITAESFGSEVYLVQTDNGPRILKFSHNEGKFWREIKTIEFLQTNILVPKIISTTHPKSGMNGAILMEKIPGKAISAKDFTKGLAEGCGEILGQLHSMPVSGLGSFEKDGFKAYAFSRWWDYRKDLVLGAWTEIIEPTVDPEILKKSKAVLNSYYEKFHSEENCLIHCDFRPGNILAHTSVTGIIDFESARTGDAAYDFIKFHEALFKNENGFWQSFLNGYSKFKSLPDLENLIPYYEFELNYGFLYWATSRSDKKLYEERLANVKKLLEAY